MRTRPADVSDEAVVDVLQSAWGLGPTVVEHLPVGFGSHHWRADAQGHRWFVTIDELDGPTRDRASLPDQSFAALRAALQAARALHDAGAGFVVAPVPTRAGDAVLRLSHRWAVALYPYVEGRSHGFGDDLSRAQRHEVVELLARLHAMPVEGTCARADDFRIPQRAGLLAAMEETGVSWESGPFGDLTRLLLARLAGDVERVLAHRDGLAEIVADADRMVLTHGEPHPGNLIETADGWRLVDWDTVLVAPPERDLWHLGTADGEVAEAYARRTGRPVLPAAFELYRMTWALTDIALFVAEFRKPHEDTGDTRVAWGGLQDSLATVSRSLHAG